MVSWLFNAGETRYVGANEADGPDEMMRSRYQGRNLIEVRSIAGTSREAHSRLNCKPLLVLYIRLAMLLPPCQELSGP